MKKFILFFPILALAIQPVLLKESTAIGHSMEVYSEKNLYHASFTYDTGNSEFIPIAEFTLYDANNAIVFHKNNFGHTLFDIGDDGVVVGIDYDGPISGKGTLHFYNVQGAETGTVEIGFLMVRSFSENGAVYCVHDGINGVRVFDNAGKELYNLGKANSCALSRDGDLIALATDDQVILFKSGQEIGRIPIGSPFIRQMVFSRDGSLFAFIDRKLLVVYGLLEKAVMFKREEITGKLEYISVGISHDNSLVAVGEDEDLGRDVQNRHARGLVNLLDQNGDVQWQTAIPYKTWNAFIPIVAFTDEQTFTVTTVENAFEYRF
ncbi:MAG TPA: hypothetical protein VF399_07970 [bacterium]